MLFLALSKLQEANADLRSVLNGGYRRGSKVYRCTTHGKKVDVEALDAFCAVAVAGLKELPDTLASRAIILRMKRRAPDEDIEPFRHRYHGPEAKPIKEELEEWCEEHEGNLIGAEPEMPTGIEDRAADCWEPLLAIADEAGDDWPDRAREAAVYLTKAHVDDLTKGVELLAHIREAFGDADKLHTAALLQKLCNRDESPWLEANYGKPLTDRGLAVQLKPYGIKSKPVRIGDVVLRATRCLGRDRGQPTQQRALYSLADDINRRAPRLACEAGRTADTCGPGAIVRVLRQHGHVVYANAVACTKKAINVGLPFSSGLCPLCPRKRTFGLPASMSAVCHEATFCRVRARRA